MAVATTAESCSVEPAGGRARVLIDHSPPGVIRQTAAAPALPPTATTPFGPLTAAAMLEPWGAGRLSRRCHLAASAENQAAACDGGCCWPSARKPPGAGTSAWMYVPVIGWQGEQKAGAFVGKPSIVTG